MHCHGNQNGKSEVKITYVYGKNNSFINNSQTMQGLFQQRGRSVLLHYCMVIKIVTQRLTLPFVDL